MERYKPRALLKEKSVKQKQIKAGAVVKRKENSKNEKIEMLVMKNVLSMENHNL